MYREIGLIGGMFIALGKGNPEEAITPYVAYPWWVTIGGRCETQ